MTRYLRPFLLTLSVLLLVLAVFSCRVDPYGAFRAARIPGFNQYKPVALPFMRLVKAYHVNWLDYDVLVTGSSRAGRGIDCRYFVDRGESCYNAGLTGGGIYEAYRFAQQQTEGLERVLVFLDFFVFLRDQKTHEAFVEERLLRRADGALNPAFLGQAVNDVYGLLFARQTLESSRKTWRWQGRPYMNRQADGMLYLDDWGGWHFDHTTLDPDRPDVRVNRQVLRYEHILKTMTSFYQERDEYPQATRQNIRHHLGWYRRLLELLYRQKSEASLIVSASHASYWQLLRQQGFYPQFEQWKRNLARINEEVARRHARPPLPLFDFSGLNSVSMTAAPQRDKPSTFNTRFTDVMHFSREVGSRMLDRVLGGCEAPSEALFGYCISSDTIEAQLQRQASLFRTGGAAAGAGG